MPGDEFAMTRPTPVTHVRITPSELRGGSGLAGRQGGTRRRDAATMTVSMAPTSSGVSRPVDHELWPSWAA